MMTTKEMFRATLKPGYWFVNVAPLGEAPDWREQVAPHVAPQNTLFGYDQKELMAKQYKRA